MPQASSTIQRDGGPGVVPSMFERGSFRDALLGLGVLALSAAVYWDSFHIKSIAQQDVLGSAWLPRATAAILAVLAVAILARAFLRRHSVTADATDPTILAPEGAPQGRLVALALGWSILYATTLTLRVDYALSTFVYLLLMIGTLGGVSRRMLVVGAVIAAIMAWGCAYVFTKVFLVDLP